MNGNGSPLKTIYEGLAKEYPELQEYGFDSFAKDMEDEENLKKVFQGLSEKDSQLKEYGFNSFKNDMYGGMQEQPKVTPDVTGLQVETETSERQEDKSVTPLQPELESELSTQYTQVELDTFKRVDENPIEFNYLSPLRQKQYREYQKQTGKGQKTLFDPGPIGDIVEDITKTGYNATKEAISLVAKAIITEKDNELVQWAKNPIAHALNKGLQQISSKYADLEAKDKETRKKLADAVVDWGKSGHFETKGTVGEYMGAAVPYIGIAAATAMTGGATAPILTTIGYGLMGMGEGGEVIDTYSHETGKEFSDTEKAAAEIMYGLAYALPVGSYLTKIVPKGAFGQVLKYAMKDPSVKNATLKTGTEIFKAFAKQTPSAAQKFLMYAANKAGHGVATIEGIEWTKMATDKFLIGRDVTWDEFKQRSGHAAGTGIFLGLATAPFGYYAQNKAIIKRRNSQKNIYIGLTEKGEAFELAGKNTKEEWFGYTPKGERIKISTKDADRAIPIPIETFNAAVKYASQNKGQLYKEAPADATLGLLNQMAGRYSYLNGQNIAIYVDKKGDRHYIKEGDIKNPKAGLTLINEVDNSVWKSNNITPDQIHVSRKREWIDTQIDFIRKAVQPEGPPDKGSVLSGLPSPEGAPPPVTPTRPPPPAPKTPTEQIDFYRGIIRQRAENTIQNKLHTSGKFITVQNEEGNLLNVKDGDLNDPSGVIIVYDETGEPKPVSIKTVTNWETKEPDAIIQELIQGFDAGVEQNVLQPQVGEYVTYQGKEYRITDDLGEYYALWDGKETPVEVPKQELIQQELDNLIQLQVQAEQEKAGVPPEPAPKEEVINTARIGKTDYQYKVDDKGVFEFSIPEGMDPKRAEKEIKATLPGEENRIQLVTENIEKPPEFPWQKPIVHKIIKAIRILPEAPKPANIPEKKEKKLTETEKEITGKEIVEKKEEPESLQKKETTELEKPEIPELNREDFPYLSDFEFKKLTDTELSDEEKAPIVEKVDIVNKAIETKHKSGVPVKEYVGLRIYC